MGVSLKWSRAFGRSIRVDEEIAVKEDKSLLKRRQPRQEQLQQRSNNGVAIAAVTEKHSWWLDVEASALAAAKTSVAVMAPALTEGGPQKPENLRPALPAAGFLTVEQTKQACQNREVLAQFVVSANVQPSKIDEQCLQGIPKDLIDNVINFKFGSGFDGLSDLIAAGTPKKESTAAVSDATAIMSDPSVGDDDPLDSMCYFKTNMGPSGEQKDSREINDIHDNVTNSVQIAAQDTGNIINDTSVTDEERQIAEEIMGLTDINVQADDLLQGIISMNNAASQEVLSGDSRLIDGCGNLMDSVIPSQSTSDGVSEIFTDSEGFPLNLNLLNEDDMIGLIGNDNMSDNSVVVNQRNTQQQQMLLQQHKLQQQEASKLAELSKHQLQIEKRQFELKRRSDFLLRRLRKFQSELVGLHAAQQAGIVLDLAQKNAKKFLNQDLTNLGQRTGSNSRNFPELVGSISSFLQKVQKNCVAQTNSASARNRNLCRYFGAGSKDNYINQNVNRTSSSFFVPQIRINGIAVEQTAGPLSTKLKILQNAFDSDCTASSSGGESCDEMQTFNNLHQQQLPILKRASWKWAQDRANVASRWTWLQGQISDLEFKIRQHTELQRQIRATKGLVMLETTVTMPTMSTTTTITTPSTLTPSFGFESTLNGYSSVLSSMATRTCGLEAGVESAATYLGSSRCRPYVKSMFRKRRLLKLEGLHLHSKKAARLTTVKCNCDGRLAYCALCTGRRDPTAGQDLELMSVQERLAIVDPCFHPVLSMPDEVTLAAHTDAILRIPEWQQKITRGGVRASKNKDGNDRINRRASDHRKKGPTRVKKSQNVTNPNIKRKIFKDKRNRNNNEKPNNSNANRKRMTKHSQQQLASPSLVQQQSQSLTQFQNQQLGLPIDEEEEATSVLSNSSKYSSPIPSPLLLQHHQGVTPSSEKNTTLKEKSFNSHSRLRQNSYDIDNIVIPYSVASSTRLEKLPYKEIIIPKWRICSLPLTVDVKNGAMQKSTADSDIEDVSDETIAQRHERSEKEETKRFMNFKHLPYQSRMRRERRAEYRYESGPNTPDPMSPHASDCGGDTMSPITSPPPTPGNVFDSEYTDSHRSGSLQNALRRKMSTRSQQEEITTLFTEEEQEKQVLPYEPRTFPLNDEDYSVMRKEMPLEHPFEFSSVPVCQMETELYSQESDSTESAPCDLEGEDPNDPEWTIMEGRETEKERIRSTVKR